MSALRIILIALVIALVSVAVTGWIVDIRHADAKLQNAYYDQPHAAVAPLGDAAGATKQPAIAEAPNPLANNATAIAEGHKLFLSRNCASCHGYDAKGGMGPNLTDSYWRYGGTPSCAGCGPAFRQAPIPGTRRRWNGRWPRRLRPIISARSRSSPAGILLGKTRSTRRTNVPNSAAAWCWMREGDPRRHGARCRARCHHRHARR